MPRRPHVGGMPWLVLSLGWCLAVPRSAVSCTCETVNPAVARQAIADVFVGTPLSRRLLERERAVAYAFLVTHVWKGAPPETTTVWTSADQGACGITFDLGVPYVVYARGQEGHLDTGLCDRDPPLRGALWDLMELGAPLSRPGVPPLVVPGVQDVLDSLDSHNPRTSRSAREALGNCRSARPEIIQALLSILRGQRPGDVERAISLFAPMGADARPAVADIARLSRDRKAAIRIRSLIVLTWVLPRSEAYPHIASALRDRDPDVLEAGMNLAGNLAPAAAGDPVRRRFGNRLLQLLGHRDKRVRLAAMEKLSWYFPDRARPLSRALDRLSRHDPDEEVRRAAADRLEGLRAPVRRPG